MSDYSNKLKDPRWQKKRLEILQRDKFACQNCFDTESTLHVHHKHYLKGVDVWDYPDRLLITLCEDCHNTEKANQDGCDETLLDILHSILLSEQIHEIGLGFANFQCLNTYDVGVSVISWAMQSPKVMDELTSKYFKYLAIQRTAQNAK